MYANLSRPNWFISVWRIEAEECLYIGDGGTFELETARALGMHPLQATWYLKDGVNQPAKRKQEFSQVESPWDIISKIK